MWGNSGDHDRSTEGGDTKKREPSCSFCTKRLKHAHTVTDDDNQHTDPVVDVDLARDMNELSFQERERVMDEVHGVAEIPEETPEFVLASLQAFDRAIEIVPKHERKAMEKAFFLRPSYASDVEFKLLFLRAEYFDATDAAARMIAYFEAKRILFGDAALAKKRVTLEDLSPDDIQYVFFSQVLDFPFSDQHHLDASGRPIFYTNIMMMDFENIHRLCRGIWYLAMSKLMPDGNDEAPTAGSIKGFCNVLHVPPDSVFQWSLAKVIEGSHQAVTLFMTSLPLRFTSIHFCYNDPTMQAVISIIQKYLGKRNRVRMRMHVGSSIEVRYAILPFGIRLPPKVVPILQPGSTSTSTDEEKHRALERMREMEEERDLIERQHEIDSGILLYPHHPKDVLIGRGQFYRDYPGNQFHQSLIEANLREYLATTDNFVKTCISMRIVQTIQDAGGRFLMLVDGKGWKTLDTSTARDKTSGSFRSKIVNIQKALKKSTKMAF